MRISVCILLLFSSSFGYAMKDHHWEDAELKMQNQQYEEAAKLYEELGNKVDSDYEEINSHKVKDLRKIYSIDELELANSQHENQILIMLLTVLPIFISIATLGVIYLKKQRNRLIQSKQKLQQAQEVVQKSIKLPSWELKYLFATSICKWKTRKT